MCEREENGTKTFVVCKTSSCGAHTFRTTDDFAGDIQSYTQSSRAHRTVSCWYVAEPKLGRNGFNIVRLLCGRLVAEADAVDAMTLVGRRGKSFILEDMTKM